MIHWIWIVTVPMLIWLLYLIFAPNNDGGGYFSGLERHVGCALWFVIAVIILVIYGGLYWW